MGALQRCIKLAAKNREETVMVEFKSNSKVNDENVMNPTAGCACTIVIACLFASECVRVERCLHIHGFLIPVLPASFIYCVKLS